jgi:aspartate-semialdehyde dehydrogenase
LDSTILLVGGNTLLGKELRERFRTGSVPHLLQPAAVEADASAIIAVHDEEVEVIPIASEDMVRGAAAVVATAHSRQALDLIRAHTDGGVPLFDLTGELSEEPGAILRAPLFETHPPEAAIHIVPHAAAWLLTLLLNDVHGHQPLKQCIATILEPASATGLPGIEELQKQCIALLAFKRLPKTVFDAQLSFNLLARFGEDSKESIPRRERRIRRELAELASMQGEGLPTASVRLVQASTFHGYAISVWVEFASRPDLPGLLEKLKQDRVDVRTDDLDPPTNAGAAGQSGYSVGAIELDPNDSRAAWFWLVADNFTLQAELAVDLLREIRA